jgi:hypothetical protein
MGDVFYIVDASGTHHKMLGIICMATLYNLVFHLKDREAQTCYEALETGWLNPFGIMHELVIDEDGSFINDVFQGMLTEVGVLVTPIPPGAH